MIHLDTTVAIALLRILIGMSSIVHHELMYGAAACGRRRANEEEIALFIASGRITLIALNEADA